MTSQPPCSQAPVGEDGIHYASDDSLLPEVYLARATQQLLALGDYVLPSFLKLP